MHAKPLPTTLQSLHDERPALLGHCYRMLGSAFDADDAVQETLLRAWRGIDRFNGRATLRTWLYRIATNVCLDALSERNRRCRPFDEGPAGGLQDPLVERPSDHWLEPVPDAQFLPADADPAELTQLRQGTRLAFVAALQYLPPRQRAALLLTEVLDWSAAEVAATLDSSVAAINSALQRARATLASRPLLPQATTPVQEAQLQRYVSAFEDYDIDTLTGLLHADVVLSMPPYTLWLEGPHTVAQWLRGRGADCRGSRLVATHANGAPAFGQYRPGADGGPHTPWSLTVLEYQDEQIVRWNAFLDTDRLFPLFGLPMALPASD